MADSGFTEKIDRRTFTKALGVGGLAGLAGCSGQSPDDSGGSNAGGGGSNGSGGDSGSGNSNSGNGSGGNGSGVGVIANLNPVSGSAAVGGKALEKGLKLRYQELEKSGGIDGAVPKRVFENDECSADTAVGVTQELVSQYSSLTAWVGGYCSPTTLSTMQTTRKEEILQVVTSAAPGVTQQDHPYVFRIFPSTNDSAPIAINYALDELGAKRVAILGINNAWGKAQTETWRNLIQESNQAEVVSFNQVPISKQDYSNEINEIRSKNPDLIYALGYHSQTRDMLKQIEEFGITIGDDVDVFIASIAGKILNDITGDETLANVYAPLIFTGPAFENFPQGAPQYMTSFVEKWDQAYDTPAIRESATGYTLAETVIQGMRAAGTTTDVPKIAKALHNLDEPFQSPLGPIEFKDTGQARLQIFIGQYNNNGKLVMKTEPRYP